MGGRGTFAAGRPVAFQYEIVGEIDGVKILEPIDKKRSRRLPEESHSERAYIKLDEKGVFNQYREYNEKHELVLEIGYHSEKDIRDVPSGHAVLHKHIYPQGKGYSDMDSRREAQKLTLHEFNKYKKYFVGISQEELFFQKKVVEEG